MLQKRITIPTLLGKKQAKAKITALTAYDYGFARILDSTEIDIVLVGDSLGMVSLGYENTLPVTMDDMVHHARAVKRALHHPLLVADMPFMSYQISAETAVANAGRLVQDGGAEAVKLEGGGCVVDRVRAIVDAGISVMGHVGLTPQSVHQFGGYKVQGREYVRARQIKKDALELEKAGAFAIVLEGMPEKLAAEITRDLRIPTIGIGAGPHCDGQILVLNDLLGLNTEFVPKFVKTYAELGATARRAVEQYIDEVKTGQFPGKEHTYAEKRPHLRSVTDKKNP
jgi:3-methyl-2-oxobutanoate hydroxymethyltransferase